MRHRSLFGILIELAALGVWCMPGAGHAAPLGAEARGVGARGATTAASVWQIPEAAWHRSFGSHPRGASGSKTSPDPCSSRQSRTKRGVPVGGIGTGSFMLNLSGSFGPWEFDVGGDDSDGAKLNSECNRGHEERFLSQAAFHVYEKTAAGQKTVKTLASEDVLKAWPRLRMGQGDYYALYPKAWFEFPSSLFPAPVGLKQFSPIIARDYRQSSLPVGLFEVAVNNPTSGPIDVSIMFTFPNAIYREDTASYEYRREGLRSFVASSSGVTGVRLQAEDPGNVPETQRTEWVIAAKDPGGAKVSYTEDWAGDGDGSDVLADFSDDGVLSNAPLDIRRKGLAGAVAIKVTLQPGERKILPFSIAWDFPITQFTNPVEGRQWWKRYTEWFPGGYRGWDIAREALLQADSWEKALDGWWEKVALETAYPVWLRRAALNELYYDVFGGVFWENGLLEDDKRYGGRPGQHLYFAHECNIYQDAETFDVRHYETRHLLTMWPEIERDVLLAWADFIAGDPEGRTPHDAGSPMNDPYFVYGQYTATTPGKELPDTDWLDLPSKFVQQSHAYWSYTGDDAFLLEAWPSIQKTLAHLATLDHDGDRLPDSESGASTTYDAMEMVGASTYVAGLYIGALEAAGDMARALGDPSASSYESQADLVRARAEEILWLPAGYYRLATEGSAANAIMTDALNGQRYAGVYGLPDVLDRQRMARHLKQVYAWTVAPFGGGGMGAVNAIDPATGKPSAGLESNEVWAGTSYFTAALMYRMGVELGDSELVNDAFGLAQGIYTQTYENEKTAYWFDTPEAWAWIDPTIFRAQQYQRARAVWELLLEIKDPFPAP